MTAPTVLAARAHRQAVALVAHQLHGDDEGRQAVLADVAASAAGMELLVTVLASAALWELRQQYADDVIESRLSCAAAIWSGVEATP